jgi:hypothetical protein
MGEDGIWVRCTKCQNVFFQTQTDNHKLGESAEIPSVRISDAKRTSDDRFSPEYAQQGKKEIENPLAQPRSASEPSVNFKRESSLNPEDGEEKEVEKEDAPIAKQTKKRHWGRMLLEIAGACVFITVTVGAVVFALYPDIRNSAILYVRPYLKGIPVLENIFPEEKQDVHVSLESLKIKDIRRRTVTNIISGSLQVIEGIVANDADYPVSQIKIRLVITDSSDAVLGQKIAYCGNILTDEELGAMTEIEIQRELSNPKGSDFPAERILPKSEIPFMVVFTQDQTVGETKTTVTVAGADRNL